MKNLIIFDFDGTLFDAGGNPIEKNVSLLKDRINEFGRDSVIILTGNPDFFYVRNFLYSHVGRGLSIVSNTAYKGIWLDTQLKLTPEINYVEFHDNDDFYLNQIRLVEKYYPDVKFLICNAS